MRGRAATLSLPAIPVLALVAILGPGPAAAGASPAPPEAAPTPSRPALAPVPRPPIDNLEPEDREQLGEERSELDRLISGGKASDAELAAAYGRVGSLYLLYDLAEAAEPALADARTLAPDEPSWAYYLGVLYQRDGRLEQAEANLSRALELRPDDLPTLIRLGQVRLARGELDAAGESFRAALALEPRSAAALEGLGTVAFREKRPREAVERFEKALAIQPQADALQHQLGLAYRDAGDLAAAKEHLALNHGHAVRFVDPLMERLAGLLKGAAIHLKRGNNALQKGLLDVAIREYRQAVEIAPDDPQNQYNLGFALIRAGRRDEAVGYFEKAIELDPGYRNAHYNLAAALAEEGRWAEAARHYGEAVRIDPLDHAAHLKWAQALLQAGEPGRAAEELQTLLPELRQDESSLAGEAEIELARVREREGDEAGAVEHYHRAAALAPGSRTAHDELAKLLGREGRFSEAAGELSRVVELAPDDVDPRFGRAMALILGGDYVGARNALEADLAALPGNLVLSHLLARLLATAPDPAARDGARAVTLAEDAFRREPGLEHAETVAMAYAEAGRFADAVAWQRRVLGQVEPRGRPEVIERNRRWLAHYERGEPVRSPWDEGREGARTR